MPLADIARLLAKKLPGREVRLIFDVGANIGQTAREARAAFPASRIHCFEPAPQARRKLEEAMAGDERVEVLPFALGARAGAAVFRARGHDTGNRIVQGEPGGENIRVAVEDGDGYCARRGIAALDLLKIDTEGHDLHVLQGFEAMLRGQAIGLVQVEVGLNPTNRKHVPLERAKAFLEARGYVLFHLDELFFEFRGVPMLRRCNAVFIAKDWVATAPLRA